MGKLNLHRFITGLIIMSTIPFFIMCTKTEKEKPAGSESAGETSQSQELMKRDEIKDQYKWNLADIYKNQDEWQQDYKWIEDNIDKYNDFEGKFGSSPKVFLEMLKFNDSINSRFGKVYLYASLAKDLDLTNQKKQALYQNVLNLQAKLGSASSYVKPEILAIPETKLQSFYQQEPGLDVYRHDLDNLLRMKPHTLTKDEEKILAYAGPLGEVYMQTYRMYTSADMKFPKVKDDQGKEIQLSHARYYSTLNSLDRDFRKRAYKAFYIPFLDATNTLTSNYYGSVKYKIFMAKSRKYTSSLAAALDQNNIPVEVYKNLIKTVNENLKPLQRWADVKRKMLKVDSIHPYDTYVTLFPAVKKEYTFDQAKEIIKKALAPLGEQYIHDIQLAFDNRWIDVYETPNKRPGAYSSGTVKGVHPYVLLNWANQLNDVFTLAHEMGHNMHSWYTQNEQPYVYADYPIFLAEIASTLNEALLMNYLIEHAESKEEKLGLIETYLNNIKNTFYRQTRFAEFEMSVNEKAENGDVLTTDQLADLFGDLYQKYWGRDVVVDKEEKYSWMRIPHFYYNFYVYQYATGFAASQALAESIIKEGQPAIDRYMQFLKAGNSDYAINILKKAGVDMTKPDPILAVTRKANELLDQMEQLMAEK